MEEKRFRITTLSSFSDEEMNENGGYSHWSKNLIMYIHKDGITISLNENEIQELVSSLPRTLGGKY